MWGVVHFGHTNVVAPCSQPMLSLLCRRGAQMRICPTTSDGVMEMTYKVHHWTALSTMSTTVPRLLRLSAILTLSRRHDLRGVRF